MYRGKEHQEVYVSAEVFDKTARFLRRRRWPLEKSSKKQNHADLPIANNTHVSRAATRAQPSPSSSTRSANGYIHRNRARARVQETCLAVGHVHERGRPRTIAAACREERPLIRPTTAHREASLPKQEPHAHSRKFSSHHLNSMESEQTTLSGVWKMCTLGVSCRRHAGRAPPAGREAIRYEKRSFQQTPRLKTSHEKKIISIVAKGVEEEVVVQQGAVLGREGGGEERRDRQGEGRSEVTTRAQEVKEALLKRSCSGEWLRSSTQNPGTCAGPGGSVRSVIPCRLTPVLGCTVNLSVRYDHENIMLAPNHWLLSELSCRLRPCE